MSEDPAPYNEKPESPKKLGGGIGKKQMAILVVVVFALWLVIGLAPVFIFEAQSDRGTFGDMFGAATSLFSGLAFLGVIYAILLQKRELELQREELRLSRLEQERMAKAQEESSFALKNQIEMMERSAMLAALTAIIESKTRIIRSLDERTVSQDVIKRTIAAEEARDEAEGKIEGILNRLEGKLPASELP